MAQPSGCGHIAEKQEVVAWGVAVLQEQWEEGSSAGTLRHFADCCLGEHLHLQMVVRKRITSLLLLESKWTAGEPGSAY